MCADWAYARPRLEQEFDRRPVDALVGARKSTADRSPRQWRAIMPALHNRTDPSALSHVVVVFPLAATAFGVQLRRVATMSGPERATVEAVGKPIGEDLRDVKIEHRQIHDHPDHLPDGIDYYSLYQLTTPERVFFFEATHRITPLPGDAIELDISVYPFDKVGNFPYPPRQSSQFSAAEMAYIRDLIADYLRTDREALQPIYAPKERVRSVRVRLP